MNLNDLRRDGFLEPESGHEEAIEFLAAERGHDSRLPWIGKLALGLGAWIAGIFFVGFVIALLNLDDELGLSLIGFFLIAGTVFLMRLNKGTFLEQLALALCLAGHLLFLFGLHDIHSSDLAGPFVGALVLCGPVYGLSKNPVQRFFSVLGVWITGWGFSVEIDTAKLGPVSVFLILICAQTVILMLLSGTGNTSRRIWRPAMWASVFGQFGILFWLANSGAWDDDGTEIERVFGVVVAVTMGSLFWHLARPEGKALRGFAGFCLLLVGMAVAGAAGVVFSLGLMAIAHARGERLLEGIGIVSLGVFLIAFYYHLGMPLIEKSITLMVSGAVFLGIRFLLLQGRTEPFLIAKGEAS